MFLFHIRFCCYFAKSNKLQHQKIENHTTPGNLQTRKPGTNKSFHAFCSTFLVSFPCSLSCFLSKNKQRKRHHKNKPESQMPFKHRAAGKNKPPKQKQHGSKRWLLFVMFCFARPPHPIQKARAQKPKHPKTIQPESQKPASQKTEKQEHPSM